MISPVLPPQAVYFPIRSGRYEVTPGLSRLGTGFGNGATDAHLFQFDDQFPRYRANKIDARAERFGKYVCLDGFDAPVAEAINRVMVVRLATEHPAFFTREPETGGGGTLDCRLTGERLRFDSAMNLMDSPAGYQNTFDALCCQVQEDIAVVRRQPDGSDWIAALHLCAPSRWAAEEKIGTSFVATHSPIPHIERINATAPRLIDAILTREPLVRFTWSISFDGLLNDHPEPSPLMPRLLWPSGGTGPLFLRVERQVLWGLPTVDAFLFAIRVYLYPFEEFAGEVEKRNAIAAGLHSMSPESRRYKGVAEHFEAIIARLHS